MGEGGSYFDAARVLWDERIDGALPALTLGAMVRTGNALEFNQARKDAHDAAIAPVVPQTVTRRQAKQALILGGLVAGVQPAIDAIPNVTQRAMIQCEWDDSQVFERQRPALIMLGSSLGLNAAQLDALFVTASTL